MFFRAATIAVVTGLALLSPAAAQPKPPTAVVSTAPLTMIGPLPMVEVRLNGSRPLLFILDTGMPTTIVDAGIAAELGLKIKDPNEVKVPGGVLQIGATPDVKVAIAGRSVDGLTLQAAPIRDLGAVIGRPLAGVLGHDVLERFTVKVDYAKGQVSLWDPASFVPPKGAVELAVAIEDNEVFVPVTITTIDGRDIVGKFKLDTGSFDTMGMNKNFVEDNKVLVEGQKRAPALGAAMGGDTLGYVFRLARIGFAGSTFPSALVSYTYDAKGTENRPNAGTIGAGLLAASDLFLDYPHKRIFVAKRSDVLIEDKVGVMLRGAGPNLDKVTVAAVLPEGPAGKAGLKAGDVIAHVDGKPASIPHLIQRFRGKGFMDIVLLRDGVQKRVRVTPEPLLP